MFYLSPHCGKSIDGIICIRDSNDKLEFVEDKVQWVSNCGGECCRYETSQKSQLEVTVY